MLEFFPDRNAIKEPLVNDSKAKRFILNSIGFALMSLGRLREAVQFFERVSVIDQDLQDDLEGASSTYQNLADLLAAIGALEQSRESSAQALDLARRAENKMNIRTSMCHQAWSEHLLGHAEKATSIFAEAEIIDHEIYPENHYLFSLRGIQHVDHLRRTGQSDYARRVTEANLQICEQEHWANQISWCHRVLGDLDSDSGDHESARAHYESALKIARSIQQRFVLIEALLALGRWQAKHPSTGSGQAQDANAAFSDLNEALGYCVESGYRIYEADVRVALAWAYLANGEKEKARQSAERALQMSNEMGYHWGKVDAEEVLKAI